jgi:hypothetical protein
MQFSEFSYELDMKILVFFLADLVKISATFFLAMLSLKTQTLFLSKLTPSQVLCRVNIFATQQYE